MLFSIGYIYLNNVLLPIKFKNLVTEKAQEYTQRNVSIESISYKIHKGILLKNISIARLDIPSKPLLKIDQISAPVLWTPIFKEKIIICPQLSINGASLFIKKHADEEWNLSDLFSALKEKSKTNSPQNNPYTFLCKSVSIQNSKITYTDTTLPEPYTEIIENLNLQASVSLTKRISAQASATIQKHNTSIEIKGDYALTDKRLQISGKCKDIELDQYIKLFFPQYEKTFPNGTLSSDGFEISHQNKQTSFTGMLTTIDSHLVFQENNIEIEGPLILQDAKLTLSSDEIIGTGTLIAASTILQLPNQTTLTGTLAADISRLQVSPHAIRIKGNYTTEKSLLSLEKNLQISGNLFAKNTSVEYLPDEKKIHIQGAFDLQQALMLYTTPRQCSGNVVLPNLSLDIDNSGYTLNTPLQISDAKIQIDNEKQITGNFQSAQVEIQNKNQGLSFSGDLSANHAFVKITPQQTFQGDLSLNNTKIYLSDHLLSIDLGGELLDASCLFDQYQFTGSPHFMLQTEYQTDQSSLSNYSGHIQLKNAVIKTPLRFNEFSQIAGILNLDTNGCDTEKITFQTDATDYTLSGKLKDFANPQIDIRLRSENISLEKILTYLPEPQRKKLGLNLDGTSTMDVKYQGPALNLSEGNIQAEAQIHQAQIQSPQYPMLNEVKNINGKLTYDNEILSWEELAFLYNKNQYSLNGNLVEWTNPHVQTSIRSEEWNAQTDFTVSPQQIAISSFKGFYSDSTINSRGIINLSNNDPFSVDLTNAFTVTLADIRSLLPIKNPQIEGMDPQGTFSGNARVKGPSSDFKNYDITLDAQSQKMIMASYALTDNFFKYTQKQQKSAFHCTTHLYEGEVSFHSDFQLFDDEIPFNTSLAIKDLDLLAVRKDKNLKLSKLSGKASLSFDGSGEAKHIEEIKGQGTFFVKDGLLGEIAIVEGLLSALNSVPGLLSNILSTMTVPDKASSSTKNYITGATGSFTVANQTLKTDDTTLLGSLYDLKVQGTIQRDQKINAMVYPNYSRFNNQNRNATEILGSPIHLKITGTLKNPQYKPIINPAKPIENVVDTTIDIFKGVGNILEDLF